MTDKELKVFRMRYGDMAFKSYRENRYGELTLTKDNGERVLYDPKVGFTRKLPRDPNNMTEKEIAIEFGKRLKTRMRFAGITQEELAEALGTSQGSISRYINGRVMPRFPMIDRIARVIGCSVDDLRYID